LITKSFSIFPLEEPGMAKEFHSLLSFLTPDQAREVQSAGRT
jgi:hypothetical protein